MSRLRNPLDAGAVDEYQNEIVARLEAGDDATALESALRSFDSAAGNAAVKYRLAQVLSAVKRNRNLTAGQVSVAVTAAGSGYALGDVIALTGGDGSGASAKVSGVTDGVAATATVTAGGSGYTSATVDATGSGDGNAVATASVNAGAVDGVTITDGGSGYQVGDALVINGDGSGATAEVASVVNGAIASLYVTGGQDYTVAPTADTTGVGNADATFDVTVSNELKVVEDVEAAVQAAV